MATESFSSYATGSAGTGLTRVYDTGTQQVTVKVTENSDASSWGTDLTLRASGNGLGATADFTFQNDATKLADPVSSVSFTIKDIDTNGFRDQVKIVAYDANGNILPDSAFSLTVGSNVAMTSVDTLPGAGDGIIGTTKGGNTQSTDPAGQLGVTINGAVSRIVVSYYNVGSNSSQAFVMISGLTFNTELPLDGIVEGTSGADLINGAYLGDPEGDRIDNWDNTGAGVAAGGGAGTHDDLVQGFGGNDTILAGEGNDTVYAGDGADSVHGDGGNDILYGYGDTLNDGKDDGANDTLRGGSGNDQLYGGLGNDSLDGGENDDTLVGGGGADMLDGGRGNDRLYGDDTLGTDTSGGADTLIGGEGADTLVGGYGNDRLFGDDTLGTSTLGGADSILGGAGNDIISGGFGDDTIYGDDIAGTDSLGGADSIDGGAGNDRIVAGAGDDTVLGGLGSDTISGGAGRDLIYGDDIAGTDSLGGADSIDAGAGDDTVVAGFGNDTIIAGDGADSVLGGFGNDIISGGLGDDTIYGDDIAGTSSLGGADSIDGGAGNDVIVAGAGDDTILGGDGADSILGGAGADSILGGLGSDTVLGGDGDDTIYGDGTAINAPAGSGDYIDGGAGNDHIYGGAGNDTIYGGAGADNITGNTGNDLIYGGDGNDTISGGGTNDGTGQDDTIYGEGGNDSIDANIGNDLVYGGIGNDWISGGVGADTVYGGADNDVIYGNEDNDLLFGDEGADTIHGGPGDDTVYGGAGNDLVRGGDGTETQPGADLLFGDDGNDTLQGGGGSDTLNGGNDADTLRGGNDDDLIYVGKGDNAQGGGGDDIFRLDTVQTGAGNAVITGGEGDEGGADLTLGSGGDTLDGNSITSDMTVTYTSDPEAGSISGGFGATFTEIEKVVTGSGNDTIDASAVTNNSTGTGINVATGEGADSITGGAGADTIDAGSGNDTILGGGGADSINAGTGADRVTGGAGNDYINLGGSGAGDGSVDVVVMTNGSGNDTIANFSAPVDLDGDGVIDAGNDMFDVLQMSDKSNVAGTIDVRDFLGPNATGSIVDTTIGGQTGALITFPNGETVFLPGVTASQLDTAQELNAVGIPCFAAGTLIETDRGAVKIEGLLPGDLVMTRDRGLQPIRWIGQRHLAGAELGDKLRPILIRKGALGPNRPSSDLMVSPQHRVLVRSAIAQKMFGTSEVLVAARQLLQLDGIDIAPVTEVTYVHMLFDQHEVVISNGAETESLFTGPEALKSVGPAAREEIMAIFPELADHDYAPVAARCLASGRMARRLAVRHVQNRKVLVS